MRIGIIGHFGGNEKFNDGQTVKTVTIYNAFQHAGYENIDKIDTYYIKKKPVKFVGLFLKSLFIDKKYIVLLSSNGRKILFPILYVLSKLGKDVYHYGIGGRLAKEVSEKPRWKKYVSSFKGNWMESIELAERLQEQGVSNAIYLPNFKKLNIVNPEELAESYSAPFRFCLFSRVMKEKGVEDAIQAVLEVNDRAGKGIAQLDIYGPIEQEYEIRFHSVLEQASEYCRYCGVIESTKSVEVLKDYYMLIFPTHWKHEGIPGTIIDALSSAIPVIARRWQYCDEMLTNNETGYIYEFDQPEKLADIIWYAVNHVSQTMNMKKRCLEKAYQYSEDYVIGQIKTEMQLK